MKKVDMELEIPEDLPNDNDDKVSIPNLSIYLSHILWSFLQEVTPVKGE